jgi:hypothetical protein
MKNLTTTINELLDEKFMEDALRLKEAGANQSVTLSEYSMRMLTGTNKVGYKLGEELNIIYYNGYEYLYY